MLKAHIHILGGGPAGATAALSALSEGSEVHLIERPSVVANPFRHKVCGEFLSPEIESSLTDLRVWDAFRSAGPARVRRIVLHFGKTSKSAILPEPAWGLSRQQFDGLLLTAACARGATLGTRDSTQGAVDVFAGGRASIASNRSRNRLFGFKAHFTGPQDDAVELFFLGGRHSGCYVGVNSIEDGKTNVCGLGPEEELKALAFDYDYLMTLCPALRAKLGPLTRAMPWMSTGPLVFSQRFEPPTDSRKPSYAAGDALSFVDPFTGSGLLAAVRSGALAGRAAAQCQPVDQFLAETRRGLRRPFQVAGALRYLVRAGWAEKLAPAIPTQWLFALTRPE